MGGPAVVLMRGEPSISKYGYGDGYGDGDGSGYGYGDGSGYGYGHGDGDGSGDGYGDGEFYKKTITYTLAEKAKDRAYALMAQGALLCYWRSTKDGNPANGGAGTKARPGLVEEIQGPLELCTKNALHGTLLPEKWKGDRMWIVALYPPYVEQEDKAGSLKREIICEALYWHRNSGVET